MTTQLTYGERAALCTNATARKLLELMETKKTNLALSADVNNSESLLALIQEVGEEICLLKTHVDILDDFSLETIARCKQLAEKQQFLLFEDRKFADIGSTVKHQYGGGMYRIADWADITNAHIVPGPGIIEGLREVGGAKNRGLLLLAEMSSKGSLATDIYTLKAVEMAHLYDDFVIGFICQGRLTQDPRFIHMTPGVQRQVGGDHLGQQYQIPSSVIAKGSDVIIVGRGIYEAKSSKEEAKIYRKEGWEAYLERFK